jgi:hypothetical protein
MNLWKYCIEPVFERSPVRCVLAVRCGTNWKAKRLADELEFGELSGSSLHVKARDFWALLDHVGAPEHVARAWARLGVLLQPRRGVRLPPELPDQRERALDQALKVWRDALLKKNLED